MGSPPGPTPERAPAPDPRPEQVCAVIVSFHPSSELLSHVAALAPQVGAVVVVDNASDARGQEVLAAAQERFRIEVIRNRRNLGLAAALNQGVAHAIQRGSLWVLTLDQDSGVPAGYVDVLFAAYRACDFRDEVALISPVYVDEGTAAPLSYAHRARTDELFAEVAATITSGNLVKIAAFARVGLFDAGLFIDYVDFDFCLRCSLAGLRLIEARAAHLTHNLGRISRHSLLGRTVSVSHHRSLRRYYSTRNRVLLYRRYVRSHPGWVARDALALAWEVVKIVGYEQQRLAKLVWGARGLRDGVRGRTGEFGQRTKPTPVGRVRSRPSPS